MKGNSLGHKVLLIQLQEMVKAGLSLEEAADGLGINVTDAKAALLSSDKSGLISLENDADKYVTAKKLEMFKVLESIAVDPEYHPSARVAAAKAFIDGGKSDDEDTFNNDKMAAMYAKMKEVVDRQNNRGGSSEGSGKGKHLNSPSNQTVVSVVSTGTETLKAAV